MAGEEKTGSGGPAADVEVRARAMGWVPQEEFRGAEDRWVDAETFVRRGEEILPILRENNKSLQTKLSAQERELAELRAAHDTTLASIEELKKHSIEETRAAVARTRKSVLAELKEAKRDADVDREVELEERLRELDRAAAPAPAPAPAPKAPPKEADPALAPDFVAWRAANPWYGADPEKTAVAEAMAMALRREGNTSVGKAFFDLVSERMDRLYGEGKRRSTKVEGGGASGGNGAAGGGRGYSDLPSDAKAVCDRQATSFVGQGKLFKTKAEWQAHYAEQFFAE